VFVVNELPHSPTGKVLKRVLAERLAADGAG
jgi:acyl-CoA synthetase (AMP-forming)/AMP-acid ligase II